MSSTDTDLIGLFCPNLLYCRRSAEPMERIWNIVVAVVATVSVVALLIMLLLSDWLVRIAVGGVMLVTTLVLLVRRPDANGSAHERSMPLDSDFTAVTHHAELDAAVEWFDDRLAARDARYLATHAAARGIKDDDE